MTTWGPETRDAFPDMLRAALHDYTDDINPILNIGITGTRSFFDLPKWRQERFTQTLARLAGDYPGIVAIHHGCCVGTDERAHEIGRDIKGCQIFGYPGKDTRGRSPHRMRDRDGFTHTFRPLTYSARNHAIVTASTLLIAVPRYPEDDYRSLRSGTWQTIRYARKANKLVLGLSK